MNVTTPPAIDETSELIKASFCEVFSTVFEMTTEEVPMRDLRRNEGMLVAGLIGFTGDANGLVYLYFEEPHAKLLASRMLGLNLSDLNGDELINDVIGEISNMVVGATKSRICDSGAACRLTIPSIIRGSHLRAEPSNASESRLFSMNCEGQTVLLELIMKAQSQT